jgi:hypothetical protein
VLRLITYVLRHGIVFLVVWTGVYLLLAPRPRVGTTPGEYVKHSAYSADESKLLLVTMPNLPFG